MSVQLEGGCSCGEIRYRLTSDPLFTHCWHCLNCQRQTGSAFVINLLIETDRLQLLAGDPVPVDVPRGAKTTQRIFRCPTCQVAVFSRYTRASNNSCVAKPRGTQRRCGADARSATSRSQLPKRASFDVRCPAEGEIWGALG